MNKPGIECKAAYKISKIYYGLHRKNLQERGFIPDHLPALITMQYHFLKKILHTGYLTEPVCHLLFLIYDFHITVRSVHPDPLSVVNNTGYIFHTYHSRKPVLARYHRAVCH